MDSSRNLNGVPYNMMNNGSIDGTKSFGSQGSNGSASSNGSQEGTIPASHNNTSSSFSSPPPSDHSGILKVHVIDTMDDAKKNIIYRVTVNCENKSWQLNKRFSEFTDLHSRVSGD